MYTCASVLPLLSIVIRAVTSDDYSPFTVPSPFPFTPALWRSPAHREMHFTRLHSAMLYTCASRLVILLCSFRNPCSSTHTVRDRKSLHTNSFLRSVLSTAQRLQQHLSISSTPSRLRDYGRNCAAQKSRHDATLNCHCPIRILLQHHTSSSSSSSSNLPTLRFRVLAIHKHLLRLLYIHLRLRFRNFISTPYLSRE